MELVGAGEHRVQRLDRDGALGLDVLALVDGADAALTEPLGDVIAPVDGRADERIVDGSLRRLGLLRRRQRSRADVVAYARRDDRDGRRLRLDRPDAIGLDRRPVLRAEARRRV
jgi:hypothetical protein